MKIAFLLRGIAKLNQYKHWKTTKIHSIDYQKNISNYHKFIFNGHSVDTFLHTYRTQDLDEIKINY